MRTDQDLRYGLSVVLPTLNEADNLAELVPQIYLEIGHLVSDLEVIIVDDSSTDATLAVVLNLQYRFPSLKIIDRRGSPRSLPNSIRDGVMNSRNAYVCWMDADGSMQPKVLSNMIESWKTCSDKSNTVVIASRFVPGGGMKGMNVSGTTSLLQFIGNVWKSNERLFTVLASWCLNKIYYRLLRGYCHDSTSGFILGPRHLLNQVSLSGQHGAYFPGMLEQLRYNGVQVVEVPYIIQLRQHGESKANTSLLHVFRSGMPYIYQIVKISQKQLKAKFVSK